MSSAQAVAANLVVAARSEAHDSLTERIRHVCPGFVVDEGEDFPDALLRLLVAQMAAPSGGSSAGIAPVASPCTAVSASSSASSSSSASTLSSSYASVTAPPIAASSSSSLSSASSLSSSSSSAAAGSSSGTLGPASGPSREAASLPPPGGSSGEAASEVFDPVTQEQRFKDAERARAKPGAPPRAEAAPPPAAPPAAALPRGGRLQGGRTVAEREARFNDATAASEVLKQVHGTIQSRNRMSLLYVAWVARNSAILVALPFPHRLPTIANSHMANPWPHDGVTHSIGTCFVAC